MFDKYIKVIRWKYLLIFLFILAISVFLRFFNFVDTLHFAHDEVVMTEAIKGISIHYLPGVGPLGSFGQGIYHGAFFYYLYKLPAIISSNSPVFLAAFTAILSIVSVLLLLIFLERTYNTIFAFIASILYTISYSVNLHGRWEWNPNTIPFFTILSIFSLGEYLRGKKWQIALFAFSIGAITQLHLVGYLFIPIALITLFWLSIRREKLQLILISILAFLVPWIPTIIHELKTNFAMYRLLLKIFLHPSHIPISQHIQNAFNGIDTVFTQATLFNPNVFWGIFLTGIFILALDVYFAFKNRSNETRNRAIISIYLLLIISFTSILFAFYPSEIFIHYGEQLFPIVFIFLGYIIYLLLLNLKLAPIALIIIVVFVYNNLNVYYNQFVIGPKYYATYKKVCEISKSPNNGIYSFSINGIENAPEVLYTCSYEENINTGDVDPSRQIIIKTDFNREFSYTIKKA